MADGIKIRDLNQVSDIREDDVLVLDRIEVDSTNSVTNHITYSDFKTELFGGDVTIGGDLHVDNINIEGNITISGDQLNANLKLDDLIDVSVPNPQANDFLMYNGSGWIVGQPQTGGGGDTGPAAGVTDYILFNSSVEPVTFIVTVGQKTPANSMFGIGSANCFYINGVEAPTLILGANREFIFDQSDITNSGLPLVFYFQLSNNSFFMPTYPYGTQTTGDPGINGKTTIKFTNTQDPNNPGFITEQTIEKLVYHAEKTTGQDHMGNTIVNAATMLEDSGIGRVSESIDLLQTRVQEVETHLATLLQLE